MSQPQRTLRATIETGKESIRSSRGGTGMGEMNHLTAAEEEQEELGEAMTQRSHLLEDEGQEMMSKQIRHREEEEIALVVILDRRASLMVTKPLMQ